MRKLTIVAIASIGLALTACNTVKGAGQDIESVGETVQDAAD